MQLTYSSSSEEFGSQDRVVLRGLFDRFVLFLQWLANTLGAQGVLATMERASPLQARAEDKQSCFVDCFVASCCFFGP